MLFATNSLEFYVLHIILKNVFSLKFSISYFITGYWNTKNDIKMASYFKENIKGV